ncbi:hypothetical protein RZS08_52615, partial [Arthrospira platensis SPKY1]|nr:hypothetical protein [Arthrospira platensis SPKY1]
GGRSGRRRYARGRRRGRPRRRGGRGRCGADRRRGVRHRGRRALRAGGRGIAQQRKTVLETVFLVPEQGRVALRGHQQATVVRGEDLALEQKSLLRGEDHRGLPVRRDQPPDPQIV